MKKTPFFAIILMTLALAGFSTTALAQFEDGVHYFTLEQAAPPSPDGTIEVTEAFSLLTGIRYSLYEWSFGDVDGDTDDVTGSLRGLLDACVGFDGHRGSGNQLRYGPATGAMKFGGGRAR